MPVAAFTTAVSESPVSLITLPVVLSGWLLIYAIRFRSARRELPSGTNLGHLVAFTASLVVISIALLPPLDTWAERLFTMHMVQHILLADLGPLLLLLGLTKVILRPLTKRFKAVERVLGPLANPFVGLATWLSIWFLWHIPALYDAALQHPPLHAIEHMSFIAAGVAFWWPLIQPVPMRKRLGGMKALGYLFGARMGLELLGIYLVWAPSVIYDFYRHTTPAWGLTDKSDQSVGAIVMMTEQTLVIAIAFSIFFFRMLDRSEREQSQREHRAV